MTSKQWFLTSLFSLAFLFPQGNFQRSSSEVQALQAQEKPSEWDGLDKSSGSDSAGNKDEELSFESALRLNVLANVYRSQGLYSYAEAIVNDLLEMRQRTLGPDHPEIATHLNNLAYLYGEQGKYSEAEPLYLRALAIMETARGADHPDVGAGLNNLAGIYRSQGKYLRAEELYHQSLTIWENALGPNHPDVAIALANLGGLYGIQGKYEQAEPLIRRALQISEENLGELSPERHRHGEQPRVGLRQKGEISRGRSLI